MKTPKTYLIETFSMFILFLSTLILQAQEAVTYESAFPNLEFEFPSEIQNAGDGSDRLFVVEQSGRIKVFDNDENTSRQQTFLDLTDIISFSSGQEIGLLGLAFHPDFAQNGYFFVYHTRSSSVSGVRVELVIARYQVEDGNINMADASSRLEILSFDKNQSESNHNGGKIAFGPDGYLYASLGDGGGGGDPKRNAQNLDNVFGSILRIDIDLDGSNPLENNPDTPDGNYEIPSDNPRVGRSGLDELYAWGLRNTWKFSFDTTSGLLWGGDVGQGEREEINLIEKGGNYGWNRFEGTRTFESSTSLVTDPDIKPIFQYDHGDGDVSITGGYVYRGSSDNTALKDKFIYGDYVSGRVWSLDYDAANGDASSTLLFRTNGENVSSFGLDEAGELYFSGYGRNAQLFKITGGDNQGPSITDIDGIGSWTELAGGTDGVVNGLAVDGNQLYVAGSFGTAGDIEANNIAVYTEGQGWGTLSSGSNGDVNAVAIDVDGHVYAGGDFTSIGGVAANNIAVWDGTAWSALGEGTDGPIAKLGIASDGVLYVGGTFGTADGSTVNNIARYDGSWSALIDSDTGTAGTNNEVRSIAFDADNVLYVGGNFDTAGGSTANRIATFDGSNWGTLGDGTSGFVQAIAINEESIFAGGNFVIAGDETVNRIARWDRASSTWDALGNGTSGNVNALVLDGDYLYAGGNFETVAPDADTDFRTKNMARWSTNEGWEALGTDTNVGTDNQVNALLFSTDQGNLYAGGNFQEAGAASASNLAVWGIEQTAPEESAITDGALFEMQPQHNTSLRLDVRGGDDANSTLVDGFRRNGNDNQQWKFISLGDELYEIEPQNAIGKRLDVAGASTANNTEIHIYEDKGSADNQIWKAIPVGDDGLYRFEPKNAPGMRLDIENVNGVPRALSRRLDTGNSQRWRLIPVENVGSITVDPETAITDISIYPNPTSGRFTVDMTGVDVRNIEILSMTGQKVFGQILNKETGRVEIDQSLSRGMYLVRLTEMSGESSTKKIMVD